jgi:hypothetical protein
MHTFIYLMALTLSSVAIAEPIIVAPEIIQQLSKKTRENEYYIKRGPAKFKIFYFDIGKAQTPYYLSNSVFKRYYKNEKKCFELTIEEKANIARKVKCQNKINQLFITGFENFKATPLKEIFALGWKGFEVEKTQENFELEAIVQPYDMYSMDRHIYGPQYDQEVPKKKFNVKLATSSKLDLTEKKLEFAQEFNLTVSKIGILSEKTAQVKSSIVSSDRSLFFSNNSGEVLIYNQYLPNPFGDYKLSINEKIPEMLKKLAEETLRGPVCFRDTYFKPTSKDCHKLIFDSHPMTRYTKVQMMLVDFKNQKVRFINE